MKRQYTDRHSNNPDFSGKAALAKALLIFVLALSVILAGSAGYASAFDDSQGVPEPVEIRPIGDTDAVPPEITAKAAALYCPSMDKFVYLKNGDEKIDPYSITKILTCYLALENLDPDKVVTASEASTRAYENGTTIYLKAGEKISIKDLIYGTLLASGNDAAYALGEAVAGSEKDFAKLMNKTVKGWGCENTHFVNANGWKNDDHYTTAHDMSIIAAKCFANKDLVKMSNTRKHTIPATNMTEARELGNSMRHTVSGAEGVTFGKTGTWDTDDCSIVIGFDREGLSEIIVLLRDTKKGRKSDVIKLIGFSQDVTPGFLVSDEGEIVEVAKVRHGEYTKVGLAVDGKTLAYPASCDAADIDVEINADNLEAPVSKGDKAGTYTVYCDGEVIGEHELIVSEDIAEGWLPSYLYISNAQTITIGKYLAGFLAVVLLLVIIAKSRKKSRKQKKSSSGGDGSGPDTPSDGENRDGRAGDGKSSTKKYEGKHFAGK